MLENYKVHRNLTKESLKKAGFHETALSYDLTESLYYTHVFVTLSIAKDLSGAVANITDENGNIYSAINNEYGQDDVRDAVKKRYEKFLAKMCKKEILFKKPERKVREFEGKTIKIKYHDPDMPRLEYVEGKSDWIDLRAAEDYTLVAGDFRLIDLGVSMQLPKGYEAHVLPHSSTFKHYGIIMANSEGIINNSYNGDGDVWKFPAYATRQTMIKKHDRIAQFRIVRNQPEVNFVEVEHLNNENRGGVGSTGVK